jgi:uncharacterized protein (TIGR00725 family)
MDKKYIVAIVGAAECSNNEQMQAAFIGRLLAEHGVVLICGGRSGVMEAACGGARAGGGLTIGVLPGDTRQDANPHIDIPIVTGMGEARNAIIINSADAVIAIGGSYGTLSELAFASKRGIPVVGLGTWQATDGEGQPLAVEIVGSAEEAVNAVMALLDDM